VLTIATLLVPVFLGAMGWILLFSPQIGLANALAKTLFGLKDAPFSIYNIPGMAVVQGLSLVPACFFMLGAAFRAMDPALEEASLTAGAGRLKALFTVTLPLAWPAIAAVMVYMFMLAVSLFEVPAIIGWPSRIFVLSSLVYFAVNPSVGLPSYGLAGAYGVLMVGLGVLLAVFYFRIARNTRKYAVVTGRGYRDPAVEAGGHLDVVDRQHVRRVGHRQQQGLLVDVTDRHRARTAGRGDRDEVGRRHVDVVDVEIDEVEAVALGHRARELIGVDDALVEQQLLRRMAGLT
jgi:ABC-type Fe3+ transport system permease subunit